MICCTILIHVLVCVDLHMAFFQTQMCTSTRRTCTCTCMYTRACTCTCTCTCTSTCACACACTCRCPCARTCACTCTCTCTHTIVIAYFKTRTYTDFVLSFARRFVRIRISVVVRVLCTYIATHTLGYNYKYAFTLTCLSIYTHLLAYMSTSSYT